MTFDWQQGPIRPIFEVDDHSRLQRRASFWTRKGRCSTLILRMILSENRFRFSGSCARRLVEGPVPLPDFDAFEQPGLGVGVCCR
ncbi:MAG: hypothetical protein E5X61_01745 [Mesorhizobium sp.]|nr:MAG: hypothetical protein E5X61_01745 [Mesorhizobium sp.]